MQNLAGMYDTVNQVKLQITSFSETGVVDLPMGHYNELELANELVLQVRNRTLIVFSFFLDWQGSYTNITAGLDAAYGDMDTTDDVQDVRPVIT